MCLVRDYAFDCINCIKQFILHQYCASPNLENATQLYCRPPFSREVSKPDAAAAAATRAAAAQSVAALLCSNCSGRCARRRKVGRPGLVAPPPGAPGRAYFALRVTELQCGKFEVPDFTRRPRRAAGRGRSRFGRAASKDAFRYRSYKCWSCVS